MRAEPEFQSATPTGFAEQTVHSQAGADQSEIHILAGDRIDAANSISSGWSGRPALDSHVDDARRIVSRSIGRLGENLDKIRASVTRRSLSIGGALVVAFGLGWACATIYNSNPDASSILLDQKVDLSPGRLDVEKDVRRNHRIANAAVLSNPAPAESNKPKLSASAASTRSAAAAPVHAEPQSIPTQGMQKSSPSRAPSASGDSDPPLPLSPVPETKPTTIAGWSVREVYGEKVVLAGPDHAWTVKTGDTVPGVGRIDTIVRWGNRWIVSTTAGLISTE
ncbi:hypothetical protein [Bradyrhizobium sp. Tv2a-2]|uniref:hypothetical protein n=1 Tax=Bradyrhizobium sp. Tv2a-2 TaxID=113395 RepID=UPI0012EB87DB|nr:hypothetical protein [Bradyrhizobium sp. Tv2a-2]